MRDYSKVLEKLYAKLEHHLMKQAENADPSRDFQLQCDIDRIRAEIERIEGQKAPVSRKPPRKSTVRLLLVVLGVVVAVLVWWPRGTPHQSFSQQQDFDAFNISWHVWEGNSSVSPGGIILAESTDIQTNDDYDAISLTVTVEAEKWAPDTSVGLEAWRNDRYSIRIDRGKLIIESPNQGPYVKEIPGWSSLRTRSFTAKIIWKDQRVRLYIDGRLIVDHTDPRVAKRRLKIRFNAGPGDGLVISGLQLTLLEVAEGVSIHDQLDNLLGSGNWFVYPNDKFSYVGVKQFSEDFPVKDPIERVDAVALNCGANVTLKTPWEIGDIPSWQKPEYSEWKEAERRRREAQEQAGQVLSLKEIIVTSQELDGLFGERNWRPNPDPVYSGYSVVVLELREDYIIKFPVINVDTADCLKYGVGMGPVRAGQRVTIWLGGVIH